MTKLNKITSVLLSAIMVIGIFSIIPFAAGAETSGNFEYSAFDDGTARIKKYIDNGSKAVTIPSTIDGYKVTEIGYSAFHGCTGLTSVTIPNSVTEIGEGAFSGCTGLTSVTIPNSVTNISLPTHTFWGCTSLNNITVDKNNKNYTSVDGVLFNKNKTKILIYPRAKSSSSYVIPSSVTKIGYSAFSGCTGLTSVTIPSSVTKIGYWAFEDCTGLESVTIPNSVTKIDDFVFIGCTSLKSVTIPSSVTEIGDSAFYGCTSLTSVTIPSSVTKIGIDAFVGCTGLKSITVDKNNKNYTSVEGVLFNKNKTEILSYPNAKGSSYVIPSSVKKIGDGAFNGCTSLKSVTIPNSVTEIGERAFNDCTGLKSVTIPNSVTKIGDYAFGYTYSNKQYVKISGFTIYGKKGTAAERYANSDGFKFVEGTAPAEPAVPTGVKLNQSSLTLGKGESYGLISTVLPANAKNKTCTWSTSNSSAATVSNTGKVTTKATGTAVITVKTVNGKTATCKVTVKPAPTSVKINPTALTLGKGESYTVSESTSNGSYANGANLKWTSTNTKVATVQKGKGNKAVIKAVGTGTANIKITLFNGKTATCKVTVKPAPTSVKINPTALTLGKGESYTISESTSKGSYANGANLKWASTNTRVATVQKGKGNKAVIKAVGTGTANIKITLFNGKTATCKVTVKPAPTSVKINPTALTLSKGESYTISESTSKGSYASGANLKWTSTDTRVATVKKGKGNKAVIKAVGTGTANIKITLFNGKTATCKVTVKPAPTSVKINPTALTLGKGESYTINESTSKGSYANGANLKWTSTNTRVATVQKGKGNKAVIKAVGTGTANIKITLFNGKTATCKVTVTTLGVPDDMKNLLSQNGNTVDDLSAVNCSQLITVDSNGATAKINFYRLQNNQWIFDNDMSCSGFVGAKGVTQDMQEGRKASPKGLYSIGDAFYINNAPATGLTSFKITKDTYWVDDPNSAYYNKRVEGTQNKDWNSAERMIEHPVEYEYGCVVNYNTNAVYNAGSAIFFHVSNKPTAGCIGTSKEFVLKYLSKLNSSSNPYILIV